MELKQYDVDPIYACTCGAYNPFAIMVEVVGGRYVEYEDANSEIERLKGELAVANAVITRFQDGCRDLIERYKIYV